MENSQARCSFDHTNEFDQSETETDESIDSDDFDQNYDWELDSDDQVPVDQIIGYQKNVKTLIEQKLSEIMRNIVDCSMLENQVIQKWQPI